MKKLLVLVLAAALSFASCKKSLNDDSASVLCTTQGVANVTAISATLIGSAYIENASEAMLQFCFYYSDTESDSASLKRNGLKVFAGKTTGPADTTFKYELTDLKPETKYYFL